MKLLYSFTGLAVACLLFLTPAFAQEYVYTFDFPSTTGGTISGYMVIDTSVVAEDEFLGYTADQIRVTVDPVLELEATSISANGTVRNFTLDPTPHIEESIDENGNPVVTIDTDPDAAQTGAVYSTEIGGTDPQLPSGLFQLDPSTQGIGYLLGAAVVDQNNVKDELVLGIIIEGSTDLAPPTSTPTANGILLGFARLNVDDESVITFDGDDTGLFTVEPFQVAVEDQIEAVLDTIGQLVDDGSLGSFVSTFISRRVEQALQAYEQGKSGKAVRRLQQAIVTTNIFAFFGLISNEDAGSLIVSMNAIIDAINNDT